MKGFVDTTVLIHVVERTEPVTARTQAFVAKNGPAVLPDYALRELVAGKLRQLCDAHNRVLAADNPGEAVTAIL